MVVHMILGFVAALVAAVLQGAASSVQAFAAGRAKGPALLAPLYVVGMGMDGVGWMVSLVALSHLPLLAVEPMLAGSLAITLLLNGVLLKVHPTRWGRIAVVLIVACVSTLAVAGQPGQAARVGSSMVIALAAGTLALVVLSVVGYRARWSTAMGVIGGLGFAGSSIAARGLHWTGWQVLAEPALWLMLILAGVGTIAFARGLECAGAEGATRVTAWMWGMELTLPSVVGLLAMGDRIRPGWGWPALVAFPLLLVATALISSPRAIRVADAPAADTRVEVPLSS